MDKQIQKLCDESVAQVALDHPCIHDWIQLPWRPEGPVAVCRCCEFQITSGAYELLKEKEQAQ
jgi:hypothetical protein